MLTEEQAKTKWCPQVRFDGEDSTFNRGYQSEDPLNMRNGRTQYICNCLGSGCMMWRWGKIPANYRSSIPREGWEHITDDDELAEYDTSEPFWREPDAERDERRLGWCGLAGRIDHA